jgi:hypothetical protein
MKPEEELAAVLRETRDIVRRPEGDFTYSSWRDADHAVAELDDLLARGPLPRSWASGIFAPTGPFHELAISSGWTQEFMDLADRFDALRMVASAAFGCSACGSPAGSVDLQESGDLRRTTFTGTLTQRIGEREPFDALWDAIVAQDSEAIHAHDPELAPWWCPGCQAAYCGDHWQHACSRTKQPPRGRQDRSRGR